MKSIIEEMHAAAKNLLRNPFSATPGEVLIYFKDNEIKAWCEHYEIDISGKNSCYFEMIFIFTQCFINFIGHNKGILSAWLLLRHVQKKMGKEIDDDLSDVSSIIDGSLTNSDYNFDKVVDGRHFIPLFASYAYRRVTKNINDLN
jgi:hypothetical protein